MTRPTGHQPIRDAERRLAELRAVRDILLPDADDAQVLSELVSINAQIATAEAKRANCKRPPQEAPA